MRHLQLTKKMSLHARGSLPVREHEGECVDLSIQLVQTDEIKHVPQDFSKRSCRLLFADNSFYIETTKRQEVQLTFTT